MCTVDPAQLDTQTYQPTAVVNHPVENGGVVGSHGVGGDVPAAVEGAGLMLWGGMVFIKTEKTTFLYHHSKVLEQINRGTKEQEK